MNIAHQPYRGTITCRVEFYAPDDATAHSVLDQCATTIGAMNLPHQVKEVSANVPWPATKSMPETYTYLEMEAALCVWEWINDVTLLNSHIKRDNWVEIRNAVGSAELRHQSIELGRWCLRVFDICTKDDRDIFSAHSYDWDIIPEIMNHAVDENGEAIIHAEALPDPAIIAPLVVKSLTTLSFDEWKKELDRQMKHRLFITLEDAGVSEMVIEGHYGDYIQGEQIGQLIDRFRDKHDLDDRAISTWLA
ncbi:MAG: hypothetical protein JJ902_05315 [Roseibium sp.]|nr:hypothetical protein [Roseibium sp.]